MRRTVFAVVATTVAAIGLALVTAPASADVVPRGGYSVTVVPHG